MVISITALSNDKYGLLPLTGGTQFVTFYLTFTKISGRAKFSIPEELQNKQRIEASAVFSITQ